MNIEEIIDLTIMADVHMSCLWANNNEPMWPLGCLNYIWGWCF